MDMPTPFTKNDRPGSCYSPSAQEEQSAEVRQCQRESAITLSGRREKPDLPLEKPRRGTSC